MDLDEFMRWLEEEAKYDRKGLQQLLNEQRAAPPQHSRYVSDFVEQLRNWLEADAKSARRYGRGITGFEVLVDDDREETIRLEPMRIPRNLTRPLDLAGIQTYFNRNWLQKQVASPRDISVIVTDLIIPDIVHHVLAPIRHRLVSQAEQESNEFKEADDQANWLHDAFVRVWEDLMITLDDDVKFSVSQKPFESLENAYLPPTTTWFVEVSVNGYRGVAMLMPQRYPGIMVHRTIEDIVKRAFPALAHAMKLE
jgi:hypothetical protein